MTRRRFMQLTPAAAGASLTAAQTAAARKPNIVFLYADDMGYGDLGCFGDPEAKTPHLDRMASEGMRLTDFHVTAPVCCPSRSGFLTGRYPQRNGLFTNIRNDMINYGYRYTMLEYATSPEMTQGLDLRETTIAQALQRAGYKTGMVGKWDSGRDFPHLPLQRGFDFFYGFANTGIDYWTHERYGIPSMFRGNELIQEEGYATDLFRREALRFIDENKDRPFFLYVPFNAPHGPSNLEKTGPQAPEQYIKLHGNPPGTPRIRYLANITCLDAAAGAILDRLRHHGLDNNTLVVFSSDNGATAVGRNKPYRGGKGDMYEGGIRVPGIARWPGRVPNAASCNSFCGTLDLFPTFLKLAGAEPAKDAGLDGHDIVPVLTKGAPSTRKDQFWELRGSRGARIGDWKWVLHTKRGVLPPADAPGELYNLEADPGETRNLASDKADVLRMVRERWNEWMDEMAKSPPRGPFASREYFRLLGFPR
jgi:arylsulfatase A-like enzyme